MRADVGYFPQNRWMLSYSFSCFGFIRKELFRTQFATFNGGNIGRFVRPERHKIAGHRIARLGGTALEVFGANVHPAPRVLKVLQRGLGAKVLPGLHRGDFFPGNVVNANDAAIGVQGIFPANMAEIYSLWTSRSPM